MIQCDKKKCINKAQYGYDFGRPVRCKKHKDDTMMLSKNRRIIHNPTAATVTRGFTWACCGSVMSAEEEVVPREMEKRTRRNSTSQSPSIKFDFKDNSSDSSPSSDIAPSPRDFTFKKTTPTVRTKLPKVVTTKNAIMEEIHLHATDCINSLKIQAVNITKQALMEVSREHKRLEETKQELLNFEAQLDKFNMIRCLYSRNTLYMINTVNEDANTSNFIKRSKMLKPFSCKTFETLASQFGFVICNQTIATSNTHYATAEMEKLRDEQIFDTTFKTVPK